MAHLYTPDNLIQIVTEDGKAIHHFRHVLSSNFLLIKDFLDDFPEITQLELQCQQEDFLSLLNYFDRNIYPTTDQDWLRVTNVVDYLNPPLTHLNRLYQSALNYLEKRDSKSYRGSSITLEHAFKKIRDPTFLTALEIQELEIEKMKQHHDSYGDLEVQGVYVGSQDIPIRPAVEPPTFRQRVSRLLNL